MKFSDAGSEVRLSGRITPSGAYEFSVRDKGIGMRPDQVETALTPFGQVDSGLNRRAEGVGLGLPIAKRFAELHGGTLTIESAEGAGTTITVTLPAERVSAPTPAARASA